ncbi:3-isopropylmalate dehydrogenase [Deltaproteobacteria bacterium]|nr:3-isopropylmalate dehydrogenase [Deltaproteobacteria bacterium]
MPTIAVVPGDGIGTEVIGEALRVLAAIAPDAQTEVFDLGAERYLRDGTTMPADVVRRFGSEFDAVLLGALGDPRVPSNVHAKDILLGSRFQLDLYINFRPCKLLDARYCPLKHATEADVDFVVFRENTEGLYTGVGGQFKRGTADEVAMEQEINTRKGVERIIRAAYAWARQNGKTRVCMSDKANAMRHGHDLWQRVHKEVAAEYPEIKSSHLYVDVLAMRLVQAPQDFEVIVTNNLFGDIITDIGAALQGGLGLASSGNINPGKAALFEPVHGSAPDIAGRGIANPFASILTVGMLLAYLGRPADEARIQKAVQRCLKDGQVTRELGGTLSSREATDAVLAAL